MRTGIAKKYWCSAGLAVVVILAAVVAGQTAVGEGQSGAPSVLQRVQMVDDPELGELIQVAIENHRIPPRRLDEKQTFEMIRKITQSYTQIKLLDQQIAQIGRKADTEGNAEIRHELLLAKAELESKRAVELANLRETMGVMPRYPFGAIKESNLRLMIELDVIAGRVYVVERIPPIRVNDSRDTLRAVGVMSWEKALDHVKTRLEDKKNLPIRVDVYRGPDGIELSEQLYRAVLELAKQAKIEKEADIRLPDLVRDASGEFLFRLIPGAEPRMQTVYLVRGRAQNSLSDNTQTLARDVEFDKAEEYIAHEFARTNHFPARVRIVYPIPMQALAERLARIIEDTTKRTGLAEFVNVTLTAVEQDKKASEETAPERSR